MSRDDLRAELLTDPRNRGLVNMDHQAATADLRDTNITRDVESITGQQLFEAVTPADYNALTSDQKGLLHAFIGMGEILVSGTNTRAALVAMFAGKPDTLGGLSALQTETVSWASLHWPKLGHNHVRLARS